MKVDKRFFNRGTWWEKKVLNLMQREDRARYYALRAGECGEPVKEIIRLMESDPERFCIESQVSGMGVKWIVTDLSLGFSFDMEVTEWSYTSSDDFREKFHKIGYVSDSVVWATNKEKYSLLEAAIHTRSVQQWAMVNESVEATKRMREKGRRETMKIYGLEEK